MRKTVFGYLVCAVALMSCSKEETLIPSAEEIPVSSTPVKITAYISENYPDASISTVFRYSNSDTTYTVTLNTYEFLAFGRSEDLLGEGLADTLCDPRHDSIGGGHPGDGHHGHGDRRHGGGHHGGGHHGIGIPSDSIPAAVKSYISANYPGYAIHHARWDTLCQFGTIMSVMIDSTFKVHQELIFDVSGIFLAEESRTKSADLPVAVTSAVNASYAAYTMREKAEVFTLPGGSKQYKVFLHKDKLRLAVVFRENGTVICEQ
jgi:hypothetical protein